MDWQSTIEGRFVEGGFQVDWIWMNRSVLFLLAWKGRGIQVYYVEWEGGLRPLKVSVIKGVFIELLSYLRRYERFERAFKGRNVVFRWMVFRELPGSERMLLEESGVKPVFVPPDGVFPLE